MNNGIVEELGKMKVIPLYAVKSMESVEVVEKALVESGILAVEVVLRTELGYEAIKKLSKNGKILVGAGTVRSLSQAEKAVECGADFIITPGLIPEVISYCKEQKLLCIPGAVTPSEIEQANSYGLNILKYFPADVYGGIKGLKVLNGPYADVKFVPTGGINEKNYIEYLKLNNVFATGGSFVMPEHYIKDHDADGLAEWLKKIKNEIESL